MGTGPTLRTAENGALLALYAFTLVAVAGFGIFALHPERLPSTGFATAIYRSSFQGFAQAHVWLSAAVLAVALLRSGIARWAPAFLFAYAVSFTSEFVGTGWGVPFGGYAYTDLLGPKLGGRVPVLIPLSWFLMAVPSWILAGRLAGPGRGRWTRVALGAALLVAWDLALDPAMSHLTPYWTWEEAGVYYGMPFLNLVGWSLTGVLLVLGLEWLGPPTSGMRPGAGWFGGYYGAILLMPLGMCVAAGLWGVLLATTAALAAVAVWARALRSGPAGETERGEPRGEAPAAERGKAATRPPSSTLGVTGSGGVR